MSNNVPAIPSTRKGDGLDSVAPGKGLKAARGDKSRKLEPISHNESAAAIVRSIRSGDPVDPKTKARFSLEWKDASLAAHEGEEGLLAWLRAQETRLADDPSNFEAFHVAVHDALRESPATIPLFEPGAVPDPPLRRMKVLGAAELAHQDFRAKWLVKRVLLADQPCVVAAPKKSLKTSVMVDLAVSLASGTPLLDHFEIEKPRKVLIFSGEAGGFEIRGRMDRVCNSRNMYLTSLDGYLFTCFDLPRLTMDEDLAELGEIIGETGAEVVILDPLYLCLMSGDKIVDAANLFHVGPILAEVTKACQSRGATLLIVHHFRKPSKEDHKPGQDAAPPQLEDIAYAGTQEFARQFVLLKRRRDYEPGTGKHHLYLTVGGSAGHSGEWSVDIEEGVLNDDFSGQFWRPKVLAKPDAIAQAQADRAANKRTKEQDRDRTISETMRRHEEQIMETLQRLGAPQTKTFLISNSKLSGKNGSSAIDRLVGDRRLLVVRKNGKDHVEFLDPDFGDA